MLKAFQHFIEKNKLCTKNDKLLVSLSGGVDSVVMLMLFLQSGYKNTGIAHCNFQLRGAASDGDETFVRELASELGLDLYIKTCDAAKYASENKLTIQEAARDLRYAWFEEVSRTATFKQIAVAHHADDQIETFFINLLRGSGTSGLQGMPVKRGKIIRPLMFASRANIEKYASENSLKYREDSSNASDKYLRNRLRHHLIPGLEKILPQSKTSIAKSLLHLQEDALVLNQLLVEKRKHLFTTKGENIHIAIDELKKFNPLDTWLYYLLKDFNFNKDTTNDLYSTLQKEEVRNSGKTFYSSTHQLLIDRGNLILQKRNKEATHSEFLIEETDTEIAFPIHLHLSIETKKRDFIFKKNPSVAYFDADKLQFPLSIRKWKEADRFVPFGMQGSKLVSDYFIDNKIDRFTKEKTWLLLSGEEIIWIIGHRASEKFRVGKECSRIMKVWVDETDE